MHRKPVSRQALRAYEAEALEARRLLATLVVNGTTSADNLVFEVDDFFIYAHMNGVAIPQPVALWDDVQINLFDGNDTVFVRNTRDEPVDIFMGSGADLIDVASQSHDLDSIVGRVRVHTSLDDVDDKLDIHDEGDSGADSYQILEGSSQPMRLRKNSGADKVHWGERDISTRVFINNSNNAVTVDPGVSMAGVDEKLTIIGDADFLNPSSSVDTLTFGGVISGNAEFRFSPGEGDDSMTVGGGVFASGGSPLLSFNGADGADTMTISGAVFTGANGGSPTIRFDGGSFDGDDFLDFTDPVDTPVYEIEVATAGPPRVLFRAPIAGRGTLEFPDVEAFHFDSTSATQGSEFRFLGLPSRLEQLIVSAGGGNDSFEFGSFSTNVHYGNEVNITVRGDAGDDSMTIDDNVVDPSTYTLTSGVFDTDDLGRIDIQSVRDLTMLLGGGDDALTISGSLLFQDVSVSGGGGRDAFTITPDSGAQITVAGDTPTTSPGDVINLVAGGARGGVLTLGGTTGSGTYAFENRDPVVFSGMEGFPIRPAPPLSPDLAAANDSGQSSLDNITNQLLLTLGNVGAASGSLVRLFRGGTQIATTTAVGTAYTFTNVPFPAGDATFAMTAAYDSPATGLTSTPSTVLNVTVDTVAPALPSTPDLQPGSDTGISNSDNVTNDATPTFTVSGPERIRLFDGLTIIADYAVPPDLTPAALADGAHPIQARSVDVAGNTSAATATLNVTIDTVPPAAPTVAPDLSAGSDTGVSSTDNITRIRVPTFTGAASPGTLVRLLVNGVSVGSQLVTALQTAYTITSASLADGSKAVAVRHEDVAGNTSAAGPTLAVTIDTVAPTVNAAAFAFQTDHSVNYTFSENVGATLTAADLSVANLTTASSVPAAAMAVVLDPLKASFSFPGLPNATLGDGDYSATLAAAGVTDVAGNPLPANHVQAFFFLNGDANRDRRVDIGDFSIVAANFNRPGTFARGDFNYSGAVEIGDFSILAARFNATLPAARVRPDATQLSGIRPEKPSRPAGLIDQPAAEKILA